MDSIGFSIIVPCFNAEKYLEQCLDSILGQSYQNFEILLINDGSSDRTRDLCEHYSQLDSRIVVLHKRNQGVSSARNDGLQLAQKEYIMFLDSDDFFMDGCLEMIAASLQESKVDILMGCNMMHYYEATKQSRYIANIKSSELTNKSKEVIMTKTIGNKKTIGIWAVWRHVYRRDLIQNANLYFDVCYAYAEDMDWLIQVMLLSETFGFIEDPICYYRFDNETSVSNLYSLRSVCNHIEILAKWIQYFDMSYFEMSNKKLICERLANKMMTIITKLGHLSESELKVAITYMKQYQSCLKYVHGLKYFAAYLLSQMIGLTNTAKLLGRFGKGV